MIYCSAGQASGCFTDRKLHNSRACVAFLLEAGPWQELKTRLSLVTLLLALQVPQILSAIAYPLLTAWRIHSRGFLQQAVPGTHCAAGTVLFHRCRVIESLILEGTLKIKVGILQLRNSLPRPADKLRWESTARDGQVHPHQSGCVTRAESHSWVCWWHFSQCSPGCCWPFLQVGTLLAPVKAGAHQDSLILLCKDALSQTAPGMFCCLEVFLPRGRTLHFPWLNFTRFLTAHFSCLLRSSGCQHNFVVHPTLLPVLPAPSFVLSLSQSLLWNDTMPWCELIAAVRLLLQHSSQGWASCLVCCGHQEARTGIWNIYYSTSKIAVLENLQMNIQGLKCLRCANTETVPWAFFVTHFKLLISALQLFVWKYILSELTAAQDWSSVLLWDMLDTAKNTFLPPTQMLDSPILMFAQAKQKVMFLIAFSTQSHEKSV